MGGRRGGEKDDVSLAVDGWSWLIYSRQLLKKVNFEISESELESGRKRCRGKGNARAAISLFFANACAFQEEMNDEAADF